MKTTQIGAQLYTLRDQCKTPKETANTLQKVADIGYTAVELAGICPIAPAELVKMAADAGITIVAMHGDVDQILNEPEKVINIAHAINCEYVCYSYPLGFDFRRAEDVVRMTAALAASGKKFREAGLTLCYHHHSLEFIRYGKITVLEHLFKNIDRMDLSFELDTYWIQHGGGNPVEWCRFAKGRLPVLHLKDYGNVNGTPTFMEVGNGNLNWKSILQAAEESGCKWFVVEQDVTPGDPLDSLRSSYEYLCSLIS